MDVRSSKASSMAKLFQDIAEKYNDPNIMVCKLDKKHDNLIIFAKSPPGDLLCFLKYIDEGEEALKELLDALSAQIKEEEKKEADKKAAKGVKSDLPDIDTMIQRFKEAI